MLYMFCSKFHMLCNSAKILKIGQDLTKLQSVKVGTFFETQCSTALCVLVHTTLCLKTTVISAHEATVVTLPLNKSCLLCDWTYVTQQTNKQKCMMSVTVQFDGCKDSSSNDRLSALPQMIDNYLTVSSVPLRKTII